MQDSNKSNLLEGKISTGPIKQGGLGGVAKRFERFEYIMMTVIAVLVVSVLTLLFMVATLLLDSLRFNSATYIEYSKKLETNEILLQTNKSLLKDSLQNQELLMQYLNYSSTSVTSR